MHLDPNQPSINTEVRETPEEKDRPKTKVPMFQWLFGVKQKENNISPVLSSLDAEAMKVDYQRVAESKEPVQNDEIDHFIKATRHIACHKDQYLTVNEQEYFATTNEKPSPEAMKATAKKSAELLNKYYNRFVNPGSDKTLSETQIDSQIQAGVLSRKDAASFFTAFHDLCSYFKEQDGDQLLNDFKNQVLCVKGNVDESHAAKLGDYEQSLITTIRTIQDSDSRLYLNMDEQGKFSTSEEKPSVNALSKAGDILRHYRNSFFPKIDREDTRPVLSRKDAALFYTLFCELRDEVKSATGKDGFSKYFMTNDPYEDDSLASLYPIPPVLERINKQHILIALRACADKISAGGRGYINIDKDGLWSSSDERTSDTKTFPEVRKEIQKLLYENPLGEGRVDSSFYRKTIKEFEEISGQDRLIYNALRKINKHFEQIEDNATSLTRHGWRPLSWARKSITSFFVSIYKVAKKAFFGSKSHEPISPKSDSQESIHSDIHVATSDAPETVSFKEQVYSIISSVEHSPQKKIELLKAMKKTLASDEQVKLIDSAIKNFSTALTFIEEIEDIKNSKTLSVERKFNLLKDLQKNIKILPEYEALHQVALGFQTSVPELQFEFWKDPKFEMFPQEKKEILQLNYSFIITILNSLDSALLRCGRDMRSRFDQLELTISDITSKTNVDYDDKILALEALKNQYQDDEQLRTINEVISAIYEPEYPEIDVAAERREVVTTKEFITHSLQVESFPINDSDSTEIVLLKQRVNNIISSLAYTLAEKFNRLEAMKKPPVSEERVKLIDSAIDKVLSTLPFSQKISEIMGAKELTDELKLKYLDDLKTTLRESSEYKAVKSTIETTIRSENEENAVEEFVFNHLDTKDWSSGNFSSQDKEILQLNFPLLRMQYVLIQEAMSKCQPKPPLEELTAPKPLEVKLGNKQLSAQISEITSKENLDLYDKIFALMELRKQCQGDKQLSIIDIAIKEQEEKLPILQTPITPPASHPEEHFDKLDEFMTQRFGPPDQPVIPESVTEVREPRPIPKDNFADLEELFGPLTPTERNKNISETPVSESAENTSGSQSPGLTPPVTTPLTEPSEIEQSGLAAKSLGGMKPEATRASAYENMSFDAIFNSILGEISLVNYHQNLYDQKQNLERTLKKITQSLKTKQKVAQDKLDMSQQKVTGITGTLKVINDLTQKFADLKQKYSEVKDADKEAQRENLIADIIAYKKEASGLGYNERSSVGPSPSK